ncbi:aminopeptidase P family N-terminal domain-containing protein [Desulfosarcina sp.]|uniref:aminopeptidase P family N-terminal domain-containing protein n=1 Tax=Desulfosarcina sp. TaxID=2027861 RepID=UPI003970A7AB
MPDVSASENMAMPSPSDSAPILLIKKHLPRVRELSRLKNIIGIRSVNEVPGCIAAFNEKLPRIVGLDLDVLPVNYFHKLKDLLDAREYVDDRR